VLSGKPGPGPTLPPTHYEGGARAARKAAEIGDIHAQYSLGVMYETGLGVPKDLVQAYRWISLAASGAVLAKDEAAYVGQCERISTIMTPQQVTEAQRLASEWNPKAAEGWLSSALS